MAETQPPKQTGAAEEAEKMRARRIRATEEVAAAQEAEHKAKVKAEAEARAQATAVQLAEAKKLLRQATPDAPIALRRVEFRDQIDLRGLPMIANITKMIDLANQTYRDWTLMFDGALVHCIHRSDAVGQSFWVPISHVAVMFPRADA